MRHEETQIILGEHEKLSFLLCYLALLHLDLAFWMSSSISMKLMVLLSLWIICYILPLKDIYEYNLLSKHTKIFSSAFYGFAQGNKGKYDFLGRKLMPLIHRPSPGKKKKETLKTMYIYCICWNFTLEGKAIWCLTYHESDDKGEIWVWSIYPADALWQLWRIYLC